MCASFQALQVGTQVGTQVIVLYFSAASIKKLGLSLAQSVKLMDRYGRSWQRCRQACKTSVQKKRKHCRHHVASLAPECELRDPCASDAVGLWSTAVHRHNRWILFAAGGRASAES